MDVRNEIENAIYELNRIITELESIAGGIRAEFDGICENRCSDAIMNKVREYRYAKRILENLLNVKLE